MSRRSDAKMLPIWLAITASMSLNHKMMTVLHPYAHLSPVRKIEDIAALFKGVPDIRDKICKGGFLREKAMVSLCQLYGFTHIESFAVIDAYLVKTSGRGLGQ